MLNEFFDSFDQGFVILCIAEYYEYVQRVNSYALSIDKIVVVDLTFIAILNVFISLQRKQINQNDRDVYRIFSPMFSDFSFNKPTKRNVLVVCR